MIEKTQTLSLSPEELMQDPAAFSGEDCGDHRDSMVQCGVVVRPLCAFGADGYEIISGSMTRSTTWPFTRLT